MSTLKWYTPRLKAIRFTGDNAQDITDAFGEKFVYEDGILTYRNDWGNQLVPVDYVVCDAMNGIGLSISPWSDFERTNIEVAGS